MRVAIVGAGNVGRSIARELIANGHEVLLIERDPNLETPRGQAIRTLLYLFERDVEIRLLRAG